MAAGALRPDPLLLDGDQAQREKIFRDDELDLVLARMLHLDTIER